MESITPRMDDSPMEYEADYADNVSLSSQSPLVFMKDHSDPPVVHRSVDHDLDRQETHIQETLEVRKTPLIHCVVPNGLSSELFAPLWMAVFKPRRLNKGTIDSTDIERLCIALLKAAQVDERPFLTVGYHIKGLCLIILHKLQSLYEGSTSLSRKIMAPKMNPTVRNRTKPRKNYENMDDEYEGPKRRRNSVKGTKTKKKMLAIEDYFDADNERRNGSNTDISNSDTPDKPTYADQGYIPMEQIEVLQLMNFGIGMGVGTDLAFYSASGLRHEKGISYHNFEHGMVDRQPISLEDIRQNRETINPDTFMDLESLSSPFMLNGYAFTPQTRISQEFSDVATTIASTDRSLQSDSVMISTPEFEKYDLDWDIYNDALKEMEDGVTSQDPSNDGAISAQPRTRRLRLEYTESDGKAVHLVKSRNVTKYDSKVVAKKQKSTHKIKIRQDQPTLDAYTTSPQLPPLCDKTEWFNNAVDSLVQSIIGNTLSIEDSVPAKTAAGNKDTEAPKKQKGELPTKKHDEKWLSRATRKPKDTKKLESMFGTDPLSTVGVLECYRKCVREIQDGSHQIEFSEVVRDKSKEQACQLFYRTLCLANADYISLSQQCYPGAQITVAPSRRFWEPIPHPKDAKA
ncbi:Conserved region of Rad21 / Rec8 like family protein [Babesia bovis T2Bo]|uniref:Conserved region of Rad21 / Rec8 like family protein n=1 Tax=Babesia bovis T2Bo TaxID=484906 RepID=UPI001C35E86B|nr:Conserved region of Rad21 / Rec8 like family protein [Babesia bovis T2Bo]EDO06083.2 Conserved region of Rad21 / Rec8 like family protein [Babesia bovis T2Bo]